ncbi:MAG: cytochrome c oxidase subunit II [Acidobacteriota bacterium]
MEHSFIDYLTGQAMLPPRGSAFAAEIDNTFLGIYWLSQILFWGITIATLYFAWRFRYKPGRVTPHQTHNTTLEILWSVVPLLICVGLFFWGMNGYMKIVVAPGDAMEVSVTGKQWLWEFTYPDGSKTINDLHVPVDKPVKFVMTSEDVLHDFFVPDMRVKMDVVPGRFTQVWFTPNVLGEHTFTCAEYCGKDHSGMKWHPDGGHGREFPQVHRDGRHGMGNLPGIRTVGLSGARCNTPARAAIAAIRSTARPARVRRGRACTGRRSNWPMARQRWSMTRTCRNRCCSPPPKWSRASSRSCRRSRVCCGRTR